MPLYPHVKRLLDMVAAGQNDMSRIPPEVMLHGAEAFVIVWCFLLCNFWANKMLYTSWLRRGYQRKREHVVQDRS